jgi:hypothetical protein
LGGALIVVLGAIVVVTGGLKGKAQHDSAATTPQAETEEEGKEVQFRLWQRTTKPLPGLDGVRVAVGDVTGGKVKIALALADGRSLVEERSVASGDRVKFEHEGRGYQIRISELRNALIGDDEVVMVLRRAAGPRTRLVLTEDEKIERLIGSVKGLQGAVFIRNGGEHSAADAVEHMRRKWENGKGRIKTAKQFIEFAASRSLLSGETYRIRMADGTEVTSEAFLKKKLAELEATPPATRPAKAKE